MSHELVRAVHMRLMVRYGSKWSALYAGIDPSLVELDWEHQLRFVRKRSIEYALDNLPPDWPPNSAQFRLLCIDRPDDNPALPAPTYKADVGRVARIMAGVTRQRAAPTAWADALRVRQAAGERLTLAQRTAIALKPVGLAVDDAADDFCV